MSSVIAWMAAEAEESSGQWPVVSGQSEIPADRSEAVENLAHVRQTKREVEEPQDTSAVFPSFDNRPSTSRRAGYEWGTPQAPPTWPEPVTEQTEELRDGEQERRIYRRRTVAMLRRYMRYSIETGRLPSLLGREFFRSKVTQYTVVTFEDRVIFVHDMEMCLERLDEFSQRLIARHILQEHDQAATAKLLHCNERTVRRLTPLALDLLSDILLEVGLMERIEATVENSCQGGKEGQNSVSDCEDGENNS
jgi:hypothetical protein